MYSALIRSCLYGVLNLACYILRHLWIQTLSPSHLVRMAHMAQTSMQKHFSPPFIPPHLLYLESLGLIKWEFGERDTCMQLDPIPASPRDGGCWAKGMMGDEYENHS